MTSRIHSLSDDTQIISALNEAESVRVNALVRARFDGSKR